MFRLDEKLWVVVIKLLWTAAQALYMYRWMQIGGNYVELEHSIASQVSYCSNLIDIKPNLDCFPNLDSLFRHSVTWKIYPEKHLRKIDFSVAPVYLASSIVIYKNSHM